MLTPTDGDLPPTKGDFALTVCVLAISKGDLPPTKDDLAGDEAFVLADNNGSAERGLAPATKGDFTGLPKGDDDAQLGKGDDALPPTTGDAGVEAVGAGGEGVATTVVTDPGRMAEGASHRAGYFASRRAAKVASRRVRERLGVARPAAGYSAVHGARADTRGARSHAAAPRTHGGPQQCSRLRPELPAISAATYPRRRALPEV